MIRITGGRYKNLQLKVPDISRPLTDRIRLSVFDTIRDFIENSNVLDLYAGSGVTGLEALSRGAASATFVDKSDKSVEIIRENIKNLNLERLTNVYKMPVSKYFSIEKKEFEIIFIDPPFDSIVKIDLDTISSVLKKDGIIVARLPQKFTAVRAGDIVNNKLSEVYKKSYGQSEVVYYKFKA